MKVLRVYDDDILKLAYSLSGHYSVKLFSDQFTSASNLGLTSEPSVQFCGSLSQVGCVHPHRVLSTNTTQTSVVALAVNLKVLEISRIQVQFGAIIVFICLGF